MSDTISRKALLDTIRQKMFDTRYDVELAMDVIKTAPAVNAKPVVHGEWSSLPFKLWQCTQCAKIFEYAYNYCPHCGSEMRKENNNVNDE